MSHLTRNAPLDLLRGVAALSVAVYHFTWYENIAHIPSMGAFAVYTFFILSGLTMQMVYRREFAACIDLDNALSFYRNRAARVLPLLVASALLGLFVYLALDKDSDYVVGISKALLTGSSLFGFATPGYLSNASGAWSLGIEMAFYTVFPVACLIVANSSLRSIAVTLVILLCGQQALMALLAHEFVPGSPSHWDHYVALLTFAPFFAIGMTMQRAEWRSGVLGLVFGLALFIVTMSASKIAVFDLYRQPVYFLTLTAGCSVSVLLVYRSDLPPFTKPLAEFLGNISYSLYLTHWLSFKVAKKGLQLLSAPASIYPLAAFVTAISLAYVSFVYFERPARALLRGDRDRKPAYCAARRDAELVPRADGVM